MKEFLTGNEPKHTLEKDGKMQTNWIKKKWSQTETDSSLMGTQCTPLKSCWMEINYLEHF